MSLEPGRYDFAVRKGASFDKTVTWYTDKERKRKKDLTGYSAKMQIRKTAADTAVLVELESANTGNTPKIELGGTAGTIRLFIPDEVTEGAPLADVKNAVYDLQLEKDGEPVYLLEGAFVFETPVTRDE